MRIIYGILGVINLFLALLGALLPIIPGFVFFMLALICFMRMSPRFKSWMQRQALYRKWLKRLHRTHQAKRQKQMRGIG